MDQKKTAPGTCMYNIQAIQKEVSRYTDDDVTNFHTSTRTSSNYSDSVSYSEFKGIAGFLDEKSYKYIEPTTEFRHRDVSLRNCHSNDSRYATAMPSYPTYPKAEQKVGSISNPGASPCPIGTTDDSLTRELSYTKINASDTRTNSAVRQTRPTYPSGSIQSKKESSAVGISTSYMKRPVSFSTRVANSGDMSDSYASGNLPKEQTRRAVVDRSTRSKANSPATGVPLGTNYNSKVCEPESPKSPHPASVQKTLPIHSLAKSKLIIHLTPMEINFAINNSEHNAFDGKLLGEVLDKWSDDFCWISIHGREFSLDVFKYQGRYYSKDILQLWLLQAMERYTNNVSVSGSVSPIPVKLPLYSLCTSVRSAARLSGERWSKVGTMKNLTTKEKRSLSLCDILYTSKAIQDTLNGGFIIKALVEIFTDGARDHELCVMEFENQYYSLENEKLWVLKHAEKVLGKLNITGNVKISMDYILFHSFTAKDIRQVDIISYRAAHTDEERFMLEYIKRTDNEL
jgi:hypothetical protein